MITEDKQKLDEIRDFIAPLKEQPFSESQLIAVLHKVQQFYNYLPKHILDEIANEMDIPTAHIWGVATFYHYFNLTPPGRYTISICLGTACYVKGAGPILETLKQHLNIDIGQSF